VGSFLWAVSCGQWSLRRLLLSLVSTSWETSPLERGRSLLHIRFLLLGGVFLFFSFRDSSLLDAQRRRFLGVSPCQYNLCGRPLYNQGAGFFLLLGCGKKIAKRTIHLPFSQAVFIFPSIVLLLKRCSSSQALFFFPSSVLLRTRHLMSLRTCDSSSSPPPNNDVDDVDIIYHG
jgi:hypothetical protein